MFIIDCYTQASVKLVSEVHLARLVVVIGIVTFVVFVVLHGNVHGEGLLHLDGIVLLVEVVQRIRGLVRSRQGRVVDLRWLDCLVGLLGIQHL